MTQTTRTHSHESQPFDELTGPFSDRGTQAAVGLLVLVLLLTLIGLGVVYYGDRFAEPAWDEHSVPAAQVD
jgi:hypothetical protein